ncbi:EAL domain-containing protein [uncultured Pseudodesulfovibrio sp.]|uniref:EAL domain-containing protein n=1 Tax=uncultured Pseudodesulfovibrio sp. TaxID=2035858 RepID=UPI0029C8CDFA|nr:EAL domain-containing protein [uncultured Pseudodesulfovibrio sp.]
MKRPDIATLIKHTPFRILLPLALTILLFAGSVFLYLLPSIEKTFLRHKKETIHELTGSVVNSIAHLHQQAVQGKISHNEAKERARELVRAMRYGADGMEYFWVNDTDMHMVVHPYRPDLEGTDLSEFSDKEGKRIFKNFVDIATQFGGGFTDYHWQWKNQPEKIAHKLSYVRGFQPWGWVVGTGFYTDDVMEEIAGYRNQIAAIFLATLLAMAALEIYVLRQTVITEKKKQKIEIQRERLVNALREGEERYRTIADFAYDWEMWIGTEGETVYCSPACERITGYPPERFFESPELVRSVILDEDRPAWDAFLEQAHGKDGDSLDFRIMTRNNQLRWVGVVGRGVSGIGMKPLGVRCSFRDITDSKGMEERLRHQALHDPLTGLANRVLCLDRIGHAMHRAARRDNYFFAVVFLDLDRFKIINDSLGHRFGDLVLMEAASRLSESVRTLDTVSRFGGDEFVLLLDELASPGEAIRIVKRIREELAKPYTMDSQEVQTTASFGIVLSPVDNVKPHDVLQHSNIAMHRAKEAGRNRFKVFTGRMLENAVDQLTMESDMRSGLEAGEFHIEYQPIMDLNDSDLMGFEALARWDHPERGPIPPSEFIPMAEESGAILQIGEWVLRNSLMTLAEWRKTTKGANNIFMSVNLSTKQFARMELDKVVLRALHDAGLPPEALKLEITESALMDYPDAAILIMKKLRRQGVRFSIDDFGTGYSSLAQLQRLQVDTIKVDRSFIARMKRDPENMEIVKAVIALAHSLKLDVVAEGVEDPDQLCSLLDLDCECVQGFYFHEPLSTSEAERLLKLRAEAGDTSPKQALDKVKQGCAE